MTDAHQTREQPGSSTELPQKLMVSAFVCTQGGCAFSAEVRRGMPIFSSEGLELGRVAAIVLNAESLQATHILLSRLPKLSGYWLVPVDRVIEVRDGSLQLSIPGSSVESLPRWNSK